MVRVGIVIIIILAAIVGLFLIKSDKPETMPLPTSPSAIYVGS